MEQPKFKHDCGRCVFLGHFLGWDIYYHPNDSDTDYATFNCRNEDDPETDHTITVGIFKRFIESNSNTELFFQLHSATHYQALLLALASRGIGHCQFVFD